MSGGAGMYRAEETPIHRLNPYTKLVFALAVSIAAFVAPNLVIQVGLFLLCLFLIYLSHSLVLVFKAIYRFMLFFLVVLFIVQALFWPGGGPVSQVGPLEIHMEGILYSCQVALRLLIVICSFYLLMATTHPFDLAIDLEQRGLPPKIAYVMLATLQAIVEMQDRLNIIIDVQKCRGVEVQGSLVVRARAYFPLVGPLIIGSILSIESRALALEMRGFSANIQKTYLHESKEQPWERWLRWALMLLTIFIGVARLAWRIR
jgi:energy-coupling factor transport system permease protein